MLKTFLTASVLSLAVAGAASAATITNGSFEDGANPGVFTTVGTGDTNITGWSVYGGTVDYIGSYWNASEGSRSIDLNGNGPGASIYQTITDLVVGQKYRLWFDLSGNTDGGPAVKITRGGVSENAESFSYASATAIPNLTWKTFSLDFWAAGITSTLIFSSQVEGAYGPALDNVRISAVPVPAAGLLLLGALAGLAGLRRRKTV